MATPRKHLPSGSLGSIVCPAWSDPPTATKSLKRSPNKARLTSGGIAWEVLGGHRPARPWLGTVAGLCTAVALYGTGAGFMMAPPKPTVGTLHAPLLVVEHEIELTPPVVAAPPEPAAPPSTAKPPPPPTRQAPTPASSAPRLANRAKAAPPPDPSAGPPPPAQASQVVASDRPSDPLDFTDFDIATGAGAHFAGGVTASTGTNTQAVHTATVDPNARPDRPQGEANLAHPVRLPAKDWRCPWPQAAESLGIDEQVVVLQALVAADGRAASVDLLADPGHGFGQAALTCARQAKFEPATDAQGRPYGATSPAIRVRFSR